MIPPTASLTRFITYFRALSPGRAVLWCYLIWYSVMVAFHFDPAPRLWVTSLGISAVIGIALLLSVATPGANLQRDRWQIVRLFLMPFCVSSFSALIKDSEFILIFSPNPAETGTALLSCGVFLATVWLIHRREPDSAAGQSC